MLPQTTSWNAKLNVVNRYGNPVDHSMLKPQMCPLPTMPSEIGGMGRFSRGVRDLTGCRRFKAVVNAIACEVLLLGSYKNWCCESIAGDKHKRSVSTTIRNTRRVLLGLSRNVAVTFCSNRLRLQVELVDNPLQCL